VVEGHVVGQQDVVDEGQGAVEAQPVGRDGGEAGDVGRGRDPAQRGTGEVVGDPGRQRLGEAGVVRRPPVELESAHPQTLARPRPGPALAPIGGSPPASSVQGMSKRSERIIDTVLFAAPRRAALWGSATSGPVGAVHDSRVHQ